MACCREGGEIYFFNMATSFQAAALGAEAVGRDVRMLVGFGLLPSAPAEALALVREQPVLRERLEAMTGS
ncbi:L-erythro-3,5-diaminohexanoate dehydrogenase [compost metagenome]